jgi:hypothetical protein
MDLERVWQQKTVEPLLLEEELKVEQVLVLKHLDLII